MGATVSGHAWQKITTSLLWKQKQTYRVEIWANFYFYEIVSTQNYQNLKYLASKATLKINSASKKAFLAARQHKIILN